ncbi:sugar transferase [Collinsella tanakaei]|nr:sugar transferase [Collinsella tanakaei]
MPPAIEGRALDAPRERVGAGVVTPEGAVLGTYVPAAQPNGESSAAIPRPGTEAFADACRRLDNRSLGYRVAKRAFDIAFSAFVIAVGFVPCVLLSVAIAADTKGSPIYTQERVGRLGRSFRIYKFRSMVVDADDVEKYLTPAQLAQWERERKVDGDPRITRLGQVLRRTSLDELPQFLNVLAGQLSVIGPRAVTFDELAHYGADASLLLSVPQGITGAWQAGPRNEATFENGERQEIELGYARHAGLSKDIRVFAATFGAMFGRERTGR